MEVAADESLGHIQLGIRSLLQQRTQMPAYILLVWLSPAVGLHEVQRAQQHGTVPLLLEQQREQLRGEELSLSEDEFLLGLCEKLPCESLDVREHIPDIFQSLGSIFLGAEELPREPDIPVLEPGYGIGRTVHIPAEKIVGYLLEGIGRPRHGREHDKVALLLRGNGCHMLHPLRGAYGGSAELQDFHKTASNLYSCYFQSSWANWYRLLRQLCHSWAV